MTRLAFVVLSYNSFGQAARLGAKIRDCIAGSKDLLVLVDNASVAREGHDDWGSLAGPNVHCIERQQNQGYSVGNNVGIDHALAQGIPNVVILNPDVAITNVQELVAAVRRHFDSDEFLCLGFRIQGVTPYLAPVNPFFLLFPAAARLYDRVMHRCWALRAETSAASAVGRVYGCAFAVRAQEFRRLGLFDERLFLYGEEAVVSIVAGRARQRILQSQGVEVEHGTSKSPGWPGLSPFRWLQQSLAVTLRCYYQFPHFIAEGCAFVSASQALVLQLLRHVGSRFRALIRLEPHGRRVSR